MLIGFKDFLNNIVIEQVHPELRDLIQGPLSSQHKHKAIVDKIKQLSFRGEKTGLEGKMPKGSSRAYLPHSEHHTAVIDNKPASFKIGTKVALHSRLDPYHDKSVHEGLSVGELQNYKENGDYYVNDRYRILQKHHDDKFFFTTNHEHGIFPPLVEHDEKNHQWGTVGHSRDIKRGEFQRLTKTSEHPEGISHEQFHHALTRAYNQDNGKHWDQGKDHEAHMDHITTHPLVDKFLHHQRELGAPPHDYAQIGNMGVFEHPNGTKHIVARDHGFDAEVGKAYHVARANYKKRTGEYPMF